MGPQKNTKMNYTILLLISAAIISIFSFPYVPRYWAERINEKYFCGPIAVGL